MPNIELYTCFRSSAVYRVRIALNLKAIEYESFPVHLPKGEGENVDLAYLELNPQGLMPTLKDGDRIFTQSLAIIEYLEELFPDPPLLPSFARDRAHVRALAQIIACDIHPLNNNRVEDYLRKNFDCSDTQWLAWYRHWIEIGLEAMESMLKREVATGTYCFGELVTLADVCLVPQIYNARRFDCDLSSVPTLLGIEDRCLQLEAFEKATPQNQPDAV